MNACSHDWLQAGVRPTLTLTIDAWQGSTDAVLTCQQCGGHAIMRLVHWHGRNLDHRVFAIYDLPAHAAAVFLKDMGTGYCDLSRHQAELNALLGAAGPARALITMSMAQGSIGRVFDSSALAGRKVRSWRDDPPVENDPHWLALFNALD